MSNSTALFRVGKTLLIGEVRNKEESVWHLETQWEFTDTGPRPIAKEIVKISEALILRWNPTFQTPPTLESEAPIRKFRDIVHENVLPFLGASAEFGGKVVVAYERDRRGVGVCEAAGASVEWTLLNDLLARSGIGEALALEGVRKVLIEKGIVDPTFRGKLSDSHKTVTEDFYVYMKINPFRDITLIREGTEVCPVSYVNGCVVLEADGEEFWVPVETEAFYDETTKDDMWYFRQGEGRKLVPDPLSALPSKVALRVHDRNRRRGTLDWDPKADLKDVAGYLTPEPEIENKYSVMGESFVGTTMYHYFFPKRYNSGALGGSDMRDQEDACELDRSKRTVAGNMRLTKNDDSEVPSGWEGEGGVAPVDDGTGAQSTTPKAPIKESGVRGSKQTIEDLVVELLNGASIEAIFAERLCPEEEERIQQEELAKAFPGAQKMIMPALDTSKVSP